MLFSFYAHSDWIDEAGKTAKGYQSGIDLLITVNRKELTDIATYWYQTGTGSSKHRRNGGRAHRPHPVRSEREDGPRRLSAALPYAYFARECFNSFNTSA